MNKLSQWWEKITLVTKLAMVLLPSVVALTIIMMIIVNLTLHVSFLNSNNDVTGWGSLLIGSAIGIYVTFAILFYSDTSQKQISDIITKQASDVETRKKFAMEQIRYSLSFCKDFVPVRKDLEQYDEVAVKKDLEDRGMTDFDQIYYANEALNDVRSVINFHAEVLDPELIHEIMGIVNYSKDFSKEWDHVDFRLLNISDGFHRRLDKFFMRYPKVDWSSH